MSSASLCFSEIHLIASLNRAAVSGADFGDGYLWTRASSPDPAWSVEQRERERENAGRPLRERAVPPPHTHTRSESLCLLQGENLRSVREMEEPAGLQMGAEQGGDQQLQVRNQTRPGSSKRRAAVSDASLVSFLPSARL